MKRTAPVLFSTILMWAVPACAWASDGTAAVMVGEVAGAAALAAAVVLLIAALGLERVARGSAIADNISYVAGACVCIAASALARWVTRLVPQGVTADQVALSSDVLMLVAITLFSVYFLRVRSALRRFLHLASASEAELAQAQAGEVRPDLSEAEGASIPGTDDDG